jgi:hypothetical protein
MEQPVAEARRNVWKRHARPIIRPGHRWR